MEHGVSGHEVAFVAMAEQPLVDPVQIEAVQGPLRLLFRLKTLLLSPEQRQLRGERPRGWSGAHREPIVPSARLVLGSAPCCT